MTPLVEACGLTTTFGRTRALDGLDLTIPEGQLVALLGPNGAGKTTFVRTVATLCRPTAGSMRVAGHDVVAEARTVRRIIGLAGQHAAVDPVLTGRQNLVLVARLFGHDRATASRQAAIVLERLGLGDAGDRQVGTYSGGMRRKLDLGSSLVGAPQLLLLDEPTTGLDPGSRNDLWDLIAELVSGGTNVLLTTQYLDEADRLADRVVIVDHGRVIADGTPAELKRRTGDDVLEIHTPTAAHAQKAAAAIAQLSAVGPTVDESLRRVTLPVSDGGQLLVDAVRRLDDAGVPIVDIALRQPTLDEAFLALTRVGGAVLP
jgi:ABC-2 type transport system ATP-binding protein